MSGPTLIAKIVPRATKKIFGKDKSKARISMPRLLDRWAEIIAPEDPSCVLPARITWKKLDEKLSAGTLHLFAPSALAAKLMYQEKIIIERVNRLFGLPDHACIKRMVVAHNGAAATRLPAPLKKKKGLMDAETAKKLESIEDPVIRARLESLARAMPSE